MKSAPKMTDSFSPLMILNVCIVFLPKIEMGRLTIPLTDN